MHGINGIVYAKWLLLERTKDVRREHLIRSRTGKRHRPLPLTRKLNTLAIATLIYRARLYSII